MKPSSFRDVEQLSAYLDGKLSGAGRTRLESRLRSEPALGFLLEDLRQTRDVLRRTPQRRAPRNFTLTPKMAGLRPPVPRAVPALSWASAAAMLLFVCTLGTSLLGRLSFGAAAPMMAAAPSGLGSGGATDNTSEAYGVGGGPPAGTEVPTTLNTFPPNATAENFSSLAPLSTPTPEGVSSQAIQATSVPAERIATDLTPAPKNPTGPFSTWQLLWLGLAAVLIGAALGIRQTAVARFRKRMGTRK
jgi:hypothetical protein